MIPSHILQKILQDMQNLFDLEGGIWDEKGKAVALFHKSTEGFAEKIKAFAQSTDFERREEGVSFFRFPIKEGRTWLISIEGDGEVAYGVGFLKSHLSTLSHLLEPRWTKENFFLRLIQGEEEVSVLEREARKKKIGLEEGRGIYLVRVQEKESDLVLKVLESIYQPYQGSCFLVQSGEVAVVLPVKDERNREELGWEILNTLQMEVMVPIKIGAGKRGAQLCHLKDSYRQARMSLEVGEVFYPEKQLLFYEELKVGHMVYALSQEACERLSKEVFQGKEMLGLEEEEEKIIHTFLDCNLNLSEAARRLYLHRNTLMNRMEKIQKRTGLDIRNFEDAMIFQLSMMLEKRKERREG